MLGGLQSLESLYKLSTGEIKLSLPTTGTGEVISTINNFSNELQTNSQKAWDDINTSIVVTEASSILRGGDTTYTPGLIDDLRKRNPDPINNPFNARNVADTIQKKFIEGGASAIFRGSADDFRDKNSWQNKATNDMINNVNWANENTRVLSEVNNVRSTFIDPYRYNGDPKIVPHTTELTLQHVKYDSDIRSGNSVNDILQFLQNNPDKFNAATISKAFNEETKFMDQVSTYWNDPNLTKSILENDGKAVFQSLLGHDIKVTNGIIEAGEATGIVMPATIQSVYNTFSNLWNNASTYIEVVGIAAISISLLWVVGEIKTITR